MVYQFWVRTPAAVRRFSTVLVQNLAKRQNISSFQQAEASTLSRDRYNNVKFHYFYNLLIMQSYLINYAANSKIAFCKL